jgi:HPt (histidine-containing phosphotransfer) domain-containing protein
MLDCDWSSDVCSSDLERMADELWQLMRDQLPEQGARLRAAWTQGDRAALQAEAHKLAGSAAYCGAPTIKGAAAALDRALHRGDVDGLEERLLAVEDAVGRFLASDRSGQPS